MLLDGAASIATAEIRRHLRDSGLLEDELEEQDERNAADEAREVGLDPEAGEREAPELDRVLDASPVIESLLAEIGRRSSLAPCLYPWRRSTDEVERVTPSPTGSSIYEFMLWLSLEDAPFRRARKWSEAEWAFDHIVVMALRAYLGPRSKSLSFARPLAPQQGPNVRPVPFREAITWLAEQLRLPKGPHVARAQRNDGGVDVVAWRAFNADGYSGIPFLLVQCTFRKDWHRKARDIVPDTWRSWIGFPKAPIVGLAVPFLLGTNDARRDEVNTEAWLFLDRLRLAELLCELPPEELPSVVGVPVALWLEHQIATFDPSVPEAADDDDAGAPYPYVEPATGNTTDE
jgi:hypothetical protein